MNETYVSQLMDTLLHARTPQAVEPIRTELLNMRNDLRDARTRAEFDMDTLLGATEYNEQQFKKLQEQHGVLNISESYIHQLYHQAKVKYRSLKAHGR